MPCKFTSDVLHDMLPLLQVDRATDQNSVFNTAFSPSNLSVSPDLIPPPATPWTLPLWSVRSTLRRRKKRGRDNSPVSRRMIRWHEGSFEQGIGPGAFMWRVIWSRYKSRGSGNYRGAPGLGRLQLQLCGTLGRLWRWRVDSLTVRSGDGTETK